MIDFQHAFHGLTELLCRHKALWTESAFVQNELSWQADHPRLNQALLTLSEADLRALEREEDLLLFLSSHLPGLETLTNSPIATPTRHVWQAPESATVGVPERKRAQIEGFVNSLLGAKMASTRDSAVVDWCSGRGLLARALHVASGARVLCLERDVKLHHRQMPEQVTFLAHDVLDALDSAYLQSSPLHTALHACGDLHLSMLRQTAQAGAPALACSPCCYHFTTDKIYYGLSRLARETELRPTRDELRLATAETTTANTLDRALRHRELLWRVAFDLHLRQLRQLDVYSRTPSVRKSLLKTSFNSFAQSLVEELARRGRRDFVFSPLSGRAEAKLMRRAQAKLSILSRLEKAQLAFRLVLERWLLLDRALFLQEHATGSRSKNFAPNTTRPGTTSFWPRRDRLTQHQPTWAFHRYPDDFRESLSMTVVMANGRVLDQCYQEGRTHYA
jgi:hypothetical protein